MKIRKTVKKIVLLSLLISVGIVLTSFLFYTYIKHVFKSEIDDQLIETAESNAYISTLDGKFDVISNELYDNNFINKKYFSDNCFSGVVDARGRFIVNSDTSQANIYHKTIQFSFYGDTNKIIWEKLVDKASVKGRAIGTVYLDNGESVYVGIVPLKENIDYYSVSLIPESVVNKELKPFIWIIISICILMGLLVLLGLSNYYVVKYLNNKKSISKSSLVYYDDNYHRHKNEITKAIKLNKEQYVYTVISIRNYLFMSEFFGYDYGENITKYVFECLSNELTNHELIERIAPMEFGILFKYENELSFRIRLNSMLKKAGKISNIDTNNLNIVTFTCGVYIIEEGDNYRKIINCAKDAMKCWAVQEKNYISFYDGDFLKRMPNNSELVEQMMDALDQGEFQVYLQPKYEVGSEQMIGAEALLRWIDKSGKEIYPSVFLPIFEANGYMDVIDLYVLRNICKIQHQRKKNGKKEIVLSMNISSQTIKENEIMERILSVVNEYQIPHTLIEFEFSEVMLYENKDYAQNIIHRMKEAGFYVSLDNFGSGYSVVEELRNIPFDIIKLDKDLLKEFNCEEGVETEFQRKFIQEGNCDMVQGFIYARPMSYKMFNNIDS